MRKFGYLIDPAPESRPMLAGAPPSFDNLPTSARVWTPDVMDQGSTQSCTGHAAKVMFDSAAVANGKDFRSSQMGMYKLGQYAIFGPDQPLQDLGAYFRSLFEQAQLFGVIHEDDCKWDPSKINDNLNFNAIINGQGQKLSVAGWYTLDDVGDLRVRSIMMALAQGYAVGGAWRVSRGFVNESAFGGDGFKIGVYDHEGDRTEWAGNHAMAIVGYDVEEKGEVYFRVQNSWGKGFVDKGFFWATREWIDEAWDLTVARIVPLPHPPERGSEEDAEHGVLRILQEEHDCIPERAQHHLPGPERNERHLSNHHRKVFVVHGRHGTRKQQTSCPRTSSSPC